LGDLGREVQILIGDVEGDDAVGREVFLVECDGLGREEMQWNSVAGEGIDDKDVELLRNFAGE